MSNLTGLQKVLKLYGSLKITGSDGKDVIYLWDYVNDIPRLKSEMTKKEIALSNKAKKLLNQQL